MDGAGAGFGGVAIWNELIDGVEQFLDIVDFLGINCYADSFAHNPVLGALFGLTGNRKFLVNQKRSDECCEHKIVLKYLAHLIEQPNFLIPNPQYLQ